MWLFLKSSVQLERMDGCSQNKKKEMTSAVPITGIKAKASRCQALLSFVGFFKNLCVTIEALPSFAANE